MFRARKAFCVERLENRRLLSAGSLDPAFGSNGVVVESATVKPNDMVVESSGEILITDSTQLMCFNTDGSVDTSFGNNGIVTPGFTVAGVAAQSDGKIVVGGSTTAGWAVARYNADGSVDTTFGAGTGQVITQAAGFTLGQGAYGVGIEPDGDIIVGGYQVQDDPETITPPIATDENIAAICFNPDGSVNTAFGTNGEVTSGILLAFGIGYTDTPQAMAIAPNGDIAIDGFVFDGSITRYDETIVFSADGGIVSTSYPEGFLTGMVSLSDDSFVYSQNDANDLPSYEPSVQFPGVESPFDFDSSVSDSDQVITNLTVQPNGQVVALGSESNGLGLVRYNSDGSVDTTFGSNGSVLLPPQYFGLSANPTAYDIAVQSNGNYLIDGNTAGGQLFLASIPGSVDVGQLPPAASCDPTSITHHRERYTFTVQYTDTQSFVDSSFGNSNILITGPHGISERAKLVSYQTIGDEVDAIYTVNLSKLNLHHPVHTFSIRIQGDQVMDKLGYTVAPGLLAQFKAVFE